MSGNESLFKEIQIDCFVLQCCGQGSQTEIYQVYIFLLGILFDNHIRGCQITMNDIQIMQILDYLAYPPANVFSLFRMFN